MHAFDVIFIDDEVSLTEIFQHYALAKYPQWRFLTFNNPLLAYSSIFKDQLSATVWIIDLMMPGKNGTEVAAAVRAHSGALPVIIAYTALDRQEIQRNPDYRDGLQHFNKIISKMEDLVGLLSLVDVWVARESMSGGHSTG